MEFAKCSLAYNNFMQLNNIFEEFFCDDNDLENIEIALLRKKEILLKKLLFLRRRRYMVLATIASLEDSKKCRSCWCIKRTKEYWEIDCQLVDETSFKESFRMTRESFETLCELLKSLEKKNTNMRAAITLKKRIAIALYALGSSAEYRTISNLFGVGKSTVCRILLEFCEVVWKCLRTLHMDYFPLTKEKIENNVKGFESLGFPQCFGAIDGCHIEVYPSKQEAVDFYNYKGWYSTNLLALVDAQCKFIYINVGNPGRCNDSEIFERSSLKAQLESCTLIDEMSKNIANVEVPILILGDSAFRLSKNLMIPYPCEVDQNESEKHFNYKLSKCRRVVENAFGQLKARFRRIGKGIDNKVDNAALIIKACCALHNFLKDNNDKLKAKWLTEQQAVERLRNYPESISVLNDSETNGVKIREAISFYLNSLGREVLDEDLADNLGISTEDDDDAADGDCGSVSMEEMKSSDGHIEDAELELDGPITAFSFLQ